MPVREFGAAADEAVAEAMAADERIIVFGEDVPMLRAPMLARFGKDRVMAAPISESAFVGAAVGAAMAGLRPIVEVMLVDFIGVAMDALLNHMSKLEAFSGGRWRCPLVVRATCGGGYGDGGQHEQALWGMLGGIPGLTVVVPSNPADAAGLMKSAIAHDGPVVFLEHKLLSQTWRDVMAEGGREHLALDVPEHGARGEVPEPVSAIPLGSAQVQRDGDDVTIVSLAVGVHRALRAADALARDGVSAEVIDLRCVSPLDGETVIGSVRKTGRMVVVDEDYREHGLSGELAACVLEAGETFTYRRVCVDGVLPYARVLEGAALPNDERILRAVRELTTTAS